MNALYRHDARAVRIVGAFFLFALVIRVALQAAPLSPTMELLLSDVLTYELPMLATIVAGSILTLRLNGVEHRFWGMLVVATTLVLITEVYWTWYAVTIDPHGPPSNDPMRLLVLAASVIFVSLIVIMTRFSEEPITTRIRFYLDVLAGMLVLYAIMYWYVGLPAVGGLELGGYGAAVATAAYPVVGSIILLGTIAVAVGWQSYVWRRWEVFVALSLGIYSLGLIAYPAWYPQLLQSEVTGSSWLTFVLGGGYFLLLAAQADRLASTEPSFGEPWPIPVVGPSWLWRAYPAAVAMALPLIGLLAIRASSEPYGTPVIVTTALLAATLAARSWLSAMERARHRVLAYTDQVTGARSMDGLNHRLEMHLQRSAEKGCEFSVVLADVVSLGLINDRMGHDAGDRALRRLAEALDREAPKGSEVVRLADDEVLALLPETRGDDAAAYARRVYGRYRIACADEAEPADITLGIAVFPEDALDVEHLLSAVHFAEGMARVAEQEPIALFSSAETTVFDAEEHLARARMRSLRATVRTLAEAVDARDPATRHHSVNVAELANALCQVLGMSDEDAQMIGLAALMHDVGKIGVRDDVLLKPGPLTPEERAQVEQHAHLGERILEPAGLEQLLPVVRHHHERWDGTGYPDGLAGDAIPVGARVLAVCDVYETITAGRPYRPAGSRDEAIAEIVMCAGTQLDPKIAYAFARMIASLSQASGPRARSGETLGEPGVTVES